MKILIMTSLLFPLLYIGCGENERVEKVESPIEKENNITKIPTTKNLLEEFGLSITDDKISLDMNKTVSFIKKMEIQMHGKADEVQHKIEKADINFTRDLGIVLTDEKVAIDLNQTKKMFQQLNILLKEVLLDKNSSKH